MRKRLTFLVGAAVLMLFIGCGSGEAPYGSTVHMTPDTFDLSSGSAYAGSGEWFESYVDVYVVNEEDEPLNGVPVDITLDFAPNQSNFTTEFIWFKNEDGDLDVVPYTCDTDARGVCRVAFRIALGYAFKVDIRASIGYSSAYCRITATTTE